MTRYRLSYHEYPYTPSTPGYPHLVAYSLLPQCYRNTELCEDFKTDSYLGTAYFELL